MPPECAVSQVKHRLTAVVYPRLCRLRVLWASLFNLLCPVLQTLPVGSEERPALGHAPGHAPSHATGVPMETPSQSEEIQYGEIDFSKLQHKAGRNLEKCSEDTEYSEVRKGGGQPPAQDPEDLYAQIKK